jgi:hypothetical protein
MAVESGNRHRHILALDGGGVRGIVTLHMLDAFENCVGIRACDFFDMFAGTSTGAIIAATLAFARLSAREILRLYDEMIDRVFEQGPSSTAIGRLFARQIYSRDSALGRLEEIFGDSRMDDLRARRPESPQAILLTTHDMVRDEELFLSNFPFRSGKPNFGRTWKVRDAVAASALSAPWYFGPYEGRFLDGGVTVFNTPARQAAVEALDYCAEPLFERGRTTLWSFGSGRFEAPFAQGEADQWRPWNWAARLFEGIHGDAEADQIHGAVRMAKSKEIEFRRYQLTVGEQTLRELGLLATVELPIALDRTDAREFLHELGGRFASRIDWSDPAGFLLRPPFEDPLLDSALWRALEPPPPATQEPPGVRLE